ncbi:PC4 and SFRS1-interacting protein [Homalodisca vitripennis]|nr:PC4 and SFRS1-interacting protein [Homalodisca vitripennis]
MSCKFRVEDLVIVKLRGHPAWPALVNKIEEKGKSYTINVIFYGSKEHGKCRPSELSNYEENKHKILNGKKITNETLVVAVKEIEEELRSRNKFKTRKSMEKVHNSPKPNVSMNLSSSFTAIYELNNTKKSSTEELVANKKDVGVNTSDFLDIHFQLNALTDKCIQLEKELSEEKQTTEKLREKQLLTKMAENEDFHTKILRQELKSAKCEILNLKTTVDLLQSDNKNLLLDVEKQSKNQCLTCFPSLSNKNKTENEIGKKYKLKPNPTAVLVPQTEKGQLLIFADSHGKGLSHLIQAKTSVSVSACVRPGARLNRVVEEANSMCKNFTKKDCVLVIGGANNVEVMGEKRIVEELKTVTNSLSHTNLILGSLPMRHDKPSLDLKVSQINLEIRNLVKNSSTNVQLLPLDDLPRYYFTAHGLHLNKKGKVSVSDMVHKLLINIKNDFCSAATTSNPPQVIENEPKFNNPPQVIENEPKIDLTHTTTPNSTLNSLLSSTPYFTNNQQEEGTIVVQEKHMSLAIDENQKDNTVGFAHCISADFHLGAGVAVVFKNKFGKPETSNLVDSRLTLQKSDDGAVVYGLVTKAIYHKKPTAADYISAFNQMTKDFKERGLRDLYARLWLIEFRLTTNAQVFVITHNEQPYGVLRNGLSHEKFVSCLRQLILSSLSQELKPPPSTPDLNSCLSLSQTSTSFNERKDGPTDVPDMMEMRSFPPLPASAAVNLSSDQQVMDVETGDSLNMEEDALNMPQESSESVVGFRKSVLNISSEVGELSDIDPLLGSSTPEAVMSSVHRTNFLEKELNKNNVG